MLQIINTKILMRSQEVQTLKLFLPKKSIKKLNLLYRASENKFSINLFYTLCSNIPNTLILIKTQYKKIIGGFTPLIWKKYEYPSGESFIFSLSQKDKFRLKNKSNAIYYSESKPGPRFGKNGYADLWISDESNISDQSYAFGSFEYQNLKYSQDSESYKKFLGGETDHFQTQQWEVFQIQF